MMASGILLCVTICIITGLFINSSSGLTKKEWTTILLFVSSYILCLTKVKSLHMTKIKNKLFILVWEKCLLWSFLSFRNSGYIVSLTGKKIQWFKHFSPSTIYFLTTWVPVYFSLPSKAISWIPFTIQRKWIK